MINTQYIRINAAYPQMSLQPFVAFVDSPSTIRIADVPRKLGNWQIKDVLVVVNYPGNETQTIHATRAGGIWQATIPASSLAGQVDDGYGIYANGIDENDMPVDGYCLGRGYVKVLSDFEYVDGTSYRLTLREQLPEQPLDGDVVWFEDDNCYKLFSDGEWKQLGGGGAIAPATTERLGGLKATERYISLDEDGDIVSLKANHADSSYEAQVAEEAKYARKVDDETEGLSDYAKKSYVDNALSAKADKSELAEKADKSELAEKADRSELNEKADKSELSAKADKPVEETDEEKVYESNFALVDANGSLTYGDGLTPQAFVDEINVIKDEVAWLPEEDDVDNVKDLGIVVVGENGDLWYNNELTIASLSSGGDTVVAGNNVSISTDAYGNKVINAGGNETGSFTLRDKNVFIGPAEGQAGGQLTISPSNKSMQLGGLSAYVGDFNNVIATYDNTDVGLVDYINGKLPSDSVPKLTVTFLNNNISPRNCQVRFKKNGVTTDVYTIACGGNSGAMGEFAIPADATSVTVGEGDTSIKKTFGYYSKIDGQFRTLDDSSVLLTYADISKNITCVGEYASGSSGTDEDRNIYVFGQQYLNTGDSAITIQFIGSVEYQPITMSFADGSSDYCNTAFMKIPLPEDVTSISFTSSDGAVEGRCTFSNGNQLETFAFTNTYDISNIDHSRAIMFNLRVGVQSSGDSVIAGNNVRITSDVYGRKIINADGGPDYDPFVVMDRDFKVQYTQGTRKDLLNVNVATKDIQCYNGTLTLSGGFDKIRYKVGSVTYDLSSYIEQHIDSKLGDIETAINNI